MGNWINNNKKGGSVEVDTKNSCYFNESQIGCLASYIQKFFSKFIKINNN